MQLNDQQLSDLMRRAQGGDGEAYTTFFRVLLPSLRSVARAVLSSNGGAAFDAEDVVQETVLAIHTKRHTWREHEPIAPWIRAIVRYKAIDLLRRRGRHGVDVDIDIFADTLAAPEEPDPTRRSDLERYVGMLQGKSGAVVKAIGLDGEDVRDVARRLAMSETAVRVALHRGLNKLSAMTLKEQR